MSAKQTTLSEHGSDSSKPGQPTPSVGEPEREDDNESSDDGGEPDPVQEDGLQKQRKKAGLPEIKLDCLPSTLANRMLTLCSTNSILRISSFTLTLKRIHDLRL